MITVVFSNGEEETVENERIDDGFPGGVTILDEGKLYTGTFYPFHRIKHIRVVND